MVKYRSSRKKLGFSSVFNHFPTEILSSISRYRRLLTQVQNLAEQLDDLRSFHDVGHEFAARFQQERQSPAYQAVFESSSPLVSVCVATYNRGPLLVERCLKSILAQSHKNLQVVVVGDGCSDDTERRVGQLRDSRVVFENLPRRGTYPDFPRWRWMVAGTVAFNRALALAEGEFVTHLDDDDEYLPSRIERLLSLAQSRRADLVWHPFWWQDMKGGWQMNYAQAFAAGMVTTSSVLYHKWLRQIPWDDKAYETREPGDANRFRKLRYLGVDAHRCDEPLLRHYREQSQAAEKKNQK